MAKNDTLTHLDPNQINRHTFSEKNDALRVEVVAGADLKLDVDTVSLVNAVKEGISGIVFPQQLPQGELKVINVPYPVKEIQSLEVEKTIIVKEIQIVEVPTIIKEVQIKEIQIPVVIEHIKTIEIEKPVIVYKTEYKEIKVDVPKHINILLALQTITILGLLINLLFRR